MYRDAKAHLDERDRAVGAILIGEALIASCERAQVVGDAHGPEAWRAIRDAHDDFPEIWRNLDRARQELARRGANVNGYDELRPLVRTRLATASDEDDADSMRVDPIALDDARRAADELKLAVPGADWAAIEQRTSGLVRASLWRRRHNRVVIVAVIALVAAGVLSWMVAVAPVKKPDRHAMMRRDLAEIALQRKLKIIELQHALIDRCEPPAAHELAKQLVMDGRGSDAKSFALSYIARCGDDEVVVRWANAPLP